MEHDNIEYKEFKSSLGLYIEDPWERLKFLFSKNPHGELHPDMMEVIQLAQIGFVAGAVIGGFIFHKEYLLNIKERSDAKMYHSRHDAYRQISSESLLGFVKGGLKWGPRIAIFTGGFKFFTACAEAYRNKVGIAEYSMGGFMVGGLLRFNYGIRGMLVGSLVGMSLGTAYGTVHVGMRKLMGLDGFQIKYGQYTLSKYLNERMAEKLAEREKLQLSLKQDSDINNSNFLNSLNIDEEPGNNKPEANLNKEEKAK